jgi:glycosyltransferase involved in cell wall biosynthesis
MRTALVAWDYPPSPSGLSNAAREIAESLVEAGADVTVFTLDRTGRSRAGGVTIVGCGIAGGDPLGVLEGRAGIGRLAAPLAVRRAVLGVHAERPFDVVEATNWYAPGAALPGHAGFAFVTRNSTPAALSREPAPSRRDRFDGWFVDRLEATSARRSAGLISNTSAHAEEIARAYRLSAGVPHAAIGLSLQAGMLERGRAASYPGTMAPVRILFVGRAERRKGFDLILDATERLAADPALDFELVLVGIAQTDLPNTLSAEARRRIRLPGRLPGERLEVEYGRSHAILAPSRYESFGLVYQEAFAYGRPVVACSADASARAFIGQPGAGLMVQPNGEDLARALASIIADGALRLTLREHAFAASGRFTRHSLGTQTLALYETAIAGRRRR